MQCITIRVVVNRFEIPPSSFNSSFVLALRYGERIPILLEEAYEPRRIGLELASMIKS